MTSATQESFPAGWYGKIPGTGDFITRRMPPAFSESWDRWLQSAIAGSRDRLGGRWRDTFLSMPIWRFVLSPGMLTPNAWAGIMAPSVDAVGRYFPLAVAAALPSASLDIVGTLMAAQSWFDDIEAIALSAIAPAADSAAIDAAIVQKPCRAEWLRFPEGRDDTVPIRSARFSWRERTATTSSRISSIARLAGSMCSGSITRTSMPVNASSEKPRESPGAATAFGATNSAGKPFSVSHAARACAVLTSGASSTHCG